MKQKHRLWIFVTFWTAAAQLLGCAAKPSSTSSDLVFRVRMQDGSMQRMQVTTTQLERLTLQDVIDSVASNDATEAVSVRVDGKVVNNPSETKISALGLKHGALLDLVSPSNTQKRVASTKLTSRMTHQRERWHPFPELAKDYEKAVRKTKARRSGGGRLSYQDLADLQSSLHDVEPQPEGSLKRVYMCHVAAQRFHVNGQTTDPVTSKRREAPHRAALLLGTVQRERIKPKKPPSSRTSLSSTTEDEEFCEVAKVHAIWEPTFARKEKQEAAETVAKDYDPALLIEQLSDQTSRVIRLADWLGLRPIGWIFTYSQSSENRSKKEDDKDNELPVKGRDICAGASLQIACMKKWGRIDGSRFATLAMEASTGATEAFQLSDVCVQMVAEGLWQGCNDDDTMEQTTSDPSNQARSDKIGRYVQTKFPVLVDGVETKELDTVLCLVNTALLSHKGFYSGSSSTNSVKRIGGLTQKTRKSLARALTADSSSSNPSLLELLSDFSVLLALWELFEQNKVKDEPSSEIMERLCINVRKWARGQKRGTELDRGDLSRLATLLQDIEC